MPAVTALAMTICSMMPQTASAQNEGLGQHMQVGLTRKGKLNVAVEVYL